MIQIRVLAPHEACRAAIDALRPNPAVANLALMRGVGLDRDGDILLFDVARESVSAVVDQLRSLGIVASGSISLSDQVTVLSAAAEEASVAAAGHPSDAILWDEIEEEAREGADMSWSFMAFLILATLIAGVGRYLDQPILIIGSMVVGPEFGPVAAICLAIARKRGALLRAASFTLFGGFAVAVAIAWSVWALAYAVGVVDPVTATTGTMTAFIVKPDGWSFVIALLAGCAGILSLTAAKSSALVGVFISITTVPAVGTIGLALAVGARDQAWSSLVQLAVNIAGMIFSGTVTLGIQWIIWRRAQRRPTHRRPKAAKGY